MAELSDFERAKALLARGVKPTLVDEPQVSVRSASLLDQLQREAVSQFGLRVSSRKRSPSQNAAAGGATHSYHLSGNALDVSGPSDKMMAFAKYAHANYGPELAELFYDPYGGFKGGKSIGAIGDHSDHVHVAYTGNAATSDFEQARALLERGVRPTLANATARPVEPRQGVRQPVVAQQPQLPPRPIAGPPKPAPGSRYRTGVYLSPFTGEAVRPRNAGEKIGRVAQQFLLPGTEDDEATNAYYERAEANPKIAPPLAPRDATEKAQAKRAKAVADRLYNSSVQGFAKELEAIQAKFRGPIENLQNQQRYLDPLSPQYKALEKKEEGLRQQMATLSRKALGEVRKQLEPGALAKELSASGPLHPYAQAFLPSLSEAKKALLERQGRAEMAALIGAGALAGGEVAGAIAAPAVRAGLGAAGKALAGTAAGKIVAEGVETGLKATERATRGVVNLPGVNPAVRGVRGAAGAIGRSLKPDEHAIANSIAGALQQPAAYVASTDPKDIKADRLLQEALTGAAAGWFITGGFRLTGEGLRFVRESIRKGLNAPDALRRAVENSSYAVKETPITRAEASTPKRAVNEAATQRLRQGERAQADAQRVKEFQEGQYTGIGRPSTGERFTPAPRVEPVVEPLPTITPKARVRPKLDLDAEIARAREELARRATTEPTPEPAVETPSFSERIAELQKKVEATSADVEGRLEASRAVSERNARARGASGKGESAVWEPEGAEGRYSFHDFDRQPRLKFGDEEPLTVQETDDLLRIGASVTSNRRWHNPNAFADTLGEIGEERFNRVVDRINTDEGVDAIDDFFNRLDQLEEEAVKKDVHTALRSTESTPRQLLERARAQGMKTPEGHKRLPILGESDTQGMIDSGFNKADLDAIYKLLNTKRRSGKEYELAGQKYSLKALIYDAKSIPNDAAVSVPRKMKGVTKTVVPERPSIKSPIRYADRDIVVVDVPGEGPTPFYRSTGHNSGKPGQWLPFEGVAPSQGGPWFDKARFTTGEVRDKSNPLHRYGNDKLRATAFELDAQNIPRGVEVADKREVNRMLGTKRSLGHNRVWDQVEGKASTPSDRRPGRVDTPEEVAANQEAIEVDLKRRAPRKPTLAADVLAKVDDELAKAKAEARKRARPLPGKGKGGRSGAVLPPEDVALYAKIAALQVAKGTLTAADYAEKMLAEFPHLAKEHLDAIWQAAKEYHDKRFGPGKWPEEKTDAVQKQTAAKGVLRKQGVQRESGLQGVGVKDGSTVTPRSRRQKAQAQKPAQEVTPAVTAPVTATVKPKSKRGTMTRPQAIAHEATVPATTGIANQKQSREVATGVLTREAPKRKGTGPRDAWAKWEPEAKRVGTPALVRRAEEIAQGQRDVAEGDMAMFVHAKRELLNDMRSARADLDSAVKNGGSAPLVGSRQVAYAQSRKALEDFVDNVQQAKGITSQVFREMQIGVRLDTGNFEEVLLEAQRRSGRQIAEGSKEWKALEDLTGKVDELNKKLQELEDPAFAEAKKSATRKARTRPANVRTREQIAQSKKAHAEKLRELFSQVPAELQTRSGMTAGVEPSERLLKEIAPEIHTELGALAKDVWEEGVLNLKDLVEKVREVIADLPGITDSDIIHAWDEAAEPGKTPDEIARGKALATRQRKRFIELEEKLASGEELTTAEKRERGEILKSHEELEDAAALKRREEAIQARIDKAKAGPLVGPPEPKPEELPHIKAMLDELEDVRKQQREAIKAAEAERLRPEREAQEAARKAEQQAKALERRKQELQERIKTATAETVEERAQRRAEEKAARAQRQADVDAEIKELQEQLQSVRNQAKDADTQAKLEAAIAAEEAKLKAGDYSPDPRRRREANETLDGMRKKLRYLKSERTLRQQVTDLEVQAEQGFGPIQGPPKPEREVSEEIRKLQARKALYEGHIKQQLAAMEPKDLRQKVKEVIRKPAALVASIDLSAPGRQGWLLGLAHPIIAGRAFKDQLKALASPEAAARQHLDLLARENAHLYKRSGLHLSDGTGVGPGEEVFMTHLFPGWKKFNPFGASERAYSAYLNRLRADTLDAMVNVAGTDEKTVKAISHYINAATGRGGSQSPEFSGAANWLSGFLFAPRFVRSRFEYLGMTSLQHGTAASRKAIFKDYLKTLGALTIALGSAAVLAKGNGFELNASDPTSADFLKLKKGRVRIDLLAGLQQAFVLGSRFAEQRSTNIKGKSTDLTKPEYGETTNEELLGRAFRSKLNPAIGTAWSLWSRTDFLGHPYGPKEALRDLVTPLSAREMVQGIVENGWSEEDAWNLLNLLGISVQIYDDVKK